MNSNIRQRERAIVLRRIAFGDADWIVTFLSRDSGRMSGIAKSARNSKRRFGGALEPGTLVEIAFVHGRGELVRIEEAVVLRGVGGILKSLERIGAMARAIDLALGFLQERQPAPEKFDLLEGRFAALCEKEPAVSETLAFEMEWLARCGYEPQVRRCARCGRDAAAKGRWSFDFEQGGVICGACAIGRGHRVFLTGQAALGLRRAGGGDEVAAGAVIRRYIDHVLGRTMKAWAV